MPPRVLLTNTNWWPASSHLAISLAGGGCKVAAAYPPKGHPLAKTTALSGRYSYSALSPMQSLARAAAESCADLIIPCDDRAAMHLHRLHEEAVAEGERGRHLAELIERSLGSPSAFPVISSRSALLRTAISEGVCIPDFTELSTSEDLQAWEISHPLPWVMKVDHSWGGLGVKVIRTKEEARVCFQQMSQPLGILPVVKRTLVNRDPFWIEPWLRALKPKITIQSYIHGSPGNCSVFCWKGEVLAGIAVRVVAAQGLTGPATVVQVIEGREMLKSAASVAGRLGLSGFHGFDFMIEDNTGTAFLVELNPRSTMPCHLRLGPGRDLVEALCTAVSGSPAVEPVSTPASDTIAYFPQAWLSDPKSEVLRTGYHDVPWSEPALLRELMLAPWPDRSKIAQLSDSLRNLSLEKRAERRIVFQPNRATELSRQKEA